MATEKIAFICDDEETISIKFGQAPKIVVVTVEDGKETAREVRDRRAGEDNDKVKRFATFKDCQVLVTRGIGHQALAKAQEMGLRVYAVRDKKISKVLRKYLKGELSHDPDRVREKEE